MPRNTSAASPGEPHAAQAFDPGVEPDEEDKAFEQYVLAHEAEWAAEGSDPIEDLPDWQ